MDCNIKNEKNLKVQGGLCLVWSQHMAVPVKQKQPHGIH